MAIRTSVPDFALANDIYVGATVNFYTVDPITGLKTATLANLYAASTGVVALANPQALDSKGKFKQPVYIQDAVIAVVSGLTVEDHETGIIRPGGSWRGTWATATVYLIGDEVKDGAAGANTANVYIAAADHTSGTWATDLAAGKWSLRINVVDVTSAKVAAEAAQAAAEVAQGAAEAADADSVAQATTATTQAGLAFASAASATASASTATTQATTATTAAITATTQAAAASASATAAATSETNASASAAAADVAKIEWQGAWSGATAYAVHDAVQSAGTSYVCIQAHTNHQPPSAATGTCWRRRAPTAPAPATCWPPIICPR